MLWVAPLYDLLTEENFNKLMKAIEKGGVESVAEGFLKGGYGGSFHAGAVMNVLKEARSTCATTTFKYSQLVTTLNGENYTIAIDIKTNI